MKLENIVTAYSLWFIPLCLIAGGLYAAILYYKEKKNEFSPPLRWILAGIRFLVVAGIAFLLLNPLIRSVKRHVEQPVVLILQDNSESVTLGNDSAYYREVYPGLVSEFSDKLGREYELKSFVFGRELKDDAAVDYSEQETNIGKAFDAVHDRFSHQNIGAMVLLSDGINNRGVNPLYSDHNFDFPVYTVALGDTSLQRDLVLAHVNFNRIAYLDNMFPMEINIMGKKCKGLGAEVIIERNNEILFRDAVSFATDNDFKTLVAQLKARETGMQKYTVRVSRLDGEVSYSNNAQDIYIDVLEDKQKVLLLADAPHPDISAIKQAVAGNVNYTLDDFLVDDFEGSPANYNLVILHGLPSVRNNSTALLRELREKNLPTLFILTGKSFLPLFNEQQTGLVINPDNLIYNEALPAVNGDFGYFSLNEKTQDAFSYLPPLVCPYGKMELLPSVTTFLYQKIGSVATRQPLWVFNQSLDRKTAVILGPGIWKWRIKEFAVSGTHKTFDELVNKTIQYLALRLDKSLFRVYSRNTFNENEDVEFEAEVYNEVYELVNEGEVSIDITGSDGTRFPFTFSKTSDAYYLNVGNLRADTYTYLATVISGGTTMTEKGEFSVTASRLEKLSTQADHTLLQNLAKKYGGEMVYPEQLNDLAAAIRDRGDIKTISYSQKRFSELLNIPYLLALILLLLSAEWFVRKRAGGY